MKIAVEVWENKQFYPLKTAQKRALKTAIFSNLNFDKKPEEVWEDFWVKKVRKWAKNEGGSLKTANLSRKQGLRIGKKTGGLRRFFGAWSKQG